MDLGTEGRGWWVDCWVHVLSERGIHTFSYGIASEGIDVLDKLITGNMKSSALARMVYSLLSFPGFSFISHGFTS